MVRFASTLPACLFSFHFIKFIADGVCLTPTNGSERKNTSIIHTKNVNSQYIIRVVVLLDFGLEEMNVKYIYLHRKYRLRNRN